MAAPLVLITAPAHPVLTAFLKEKRYTVITHLHIDTPTLIRQYAPELAGIVLSTHLPVQEEWVGQCPKLRWIGRLGSGLDHIDLSYLSQRNIQCIATPEGNAAAVAQFCLGALLSIMRHIPRSYQEVRDDKWFREANRGHELHAALTAGIIGYGNTGRAFAEILQPFGLRILANDLVREKVQDNAQIRYASVEEITAQADIISLHIPYNTSNHHYACAAFFQKIQKPLYFLNASRGKVLDTAAFLAAVTEGKIKAAALDVLENEKIDRLSSFEQAHFAALKAHKNILLTPHIAGYSFEALYKMAQTLCDKLQRHYLV